MAFSLTTLPAKLMAYITGLTLAAFWVAAGASRNWGNALPDDVHTYGIRFRRGADLFFRPSVGWFIEHGFWVCVGFAALVIVLEVLGRLVRR